MFLAHSSADKPQVQQIFEELRRGGLNPWLDSEQIPPGRWFQDVIQQAIPDVRTAAVFFGPGGVGKWQGIELRAFMNECVERDMSLIPVLLPGVTDLPAEFPFLRQLRWVRFARSVSEPDALDHLKWGITGKRPASAGATGV